jgi:phosphatidylglycerol---prolipoprotein diacylglyceryl transferase
MHPTLFEIGAFRLTSYGLMMMLAFLAGIGMAMRRSRAAGIPADFVADLTTVILIGSLLGARGLYVLTHLDEFSGRWLDTIKPVQADGTIGIAGLVLLGGVLAAIPLTIWYTRRKGQSVLETIDLLVPSLALGIAIGRVGCLLNGCCYGKACGCGWAIHYPAESPLHALGAVHPTQVYLILGNLALMALLLWTARKRAFPGQVFALFLLLYSPLRFTVEFLRDYEPAMIRGQLGAWAVTTSQLLTLGMFAAGLGLYIYWKQQAQPGTPTAQGPDAPSSGGEGRR